VGYTGNSSTMWLDAGKAPASALWVASHACVLFQSATVSDDNNPGICINNASCANFVVAQDFGGNVNCIVRNVGISAIGMTTMSQTSFDRHDDLPQQMRDGVSVMVGRLGGAASRTRSDP
jgi:hypothetical protein